MKQQSVTLSGYFKEWMDTYKKPIVTTGTYTNYVNTYKQIKRYFSYATVANLTPKQYQEALNQYATTHAFSSTSSFHKHIHACLLDAIDEQIIRVDPSRKAIISGYNDRSKKTNYLDYDQFTKLIQLLYLSSNTMEQIIYLAAVTGLRFAEILALTWSDINFNNNILTVNKTWNYKQGGGYMQTKSKSSNRSLDLDAKTINMLHLIKTNGFFRENAKERIFHNKQIYPSTINRHLEKICRKINAHRITFHGLRHTHASILLYKGVNTLAVSKRLGHSNVSTTQNIYFHIIYEMELREKELIKNTIEEVLC